MILHTLLGRELRAAVRNRRSFALRTLVVALTAMILATLWPSQERVDFDDLSRTGQELFLSLYYTLLALVCLLTPVVVGRVVAAEKENRTLELLLLTPASPVSITLGKILSQSALLISILVVSLPFLVACLFFGGVSSGQILKGFTALMAVACLTAAISLFFSVICNGVGMAVALTFVCILFYTLTLAQVLAVVMAVAAGGASSTFASYVCSFLMGMNPYFVALMLPALLTPGAPFPLSYGAFLAGTLIPSLFFFLCATLLLRRAGIRNPVGYRRRGDLDRPSASARRKAKRGETKAAAVRETARRIRRRRGYRGPVWTDPLLWKELRVGGGVAAQIVSIVALVSVLLMVGFLMLVGMWAMFAGRGQPEKELIYGVGLTFLFVEWVSVWISATVFASLAVTSERAAATLEPILASPVGSFRFLFGKAAGSLRAVGFLLGFIVLHNAGMFLVCPVGMPWIFSLNLLAMATMVFCIMVGLTTSLQSVSSVRSTGIALLTLLALWAGVPLLLWAFGADESVMHAVIGGTNPFVPMFGFAEHAVKSLESHGWGPSVSRTQEVITYGVVCFSFLIGVSSLLFIYLRARFQQLAYRDVALRKA